MKRSHDYCEPEVVEVDPKAKALSYLRRCGNKRPFIAIDLDFTLWPSNCFEHTQGPYSKITESDPSNEVSCIDRRTNAFRKLQLYSEVREVLEWCIDNEVLLTICSSSPSKELVEEILKSFNMLEWFFMPQVFNARKSYHFRNLVEYSGVKIEDFLFFDDTVRNVELCNSIGVTSIQVDAEVGLNWNTFLKGLKTFSAKHKKVVRFDSWNSMSSSGSMDESNRRRNNVLGEDEGSDSDNSVFEENRL